MENNKHKMILGADKELDELCAKLGVKRGCSFRIKLANHKKSTYQNIRKEFVTDNGCEQWLKENLSRQFVIAFELYFYGDYDEGYDALYGGNEKLQNFLSQGLLVVNREQTKKTSLAS